MASKRTPAPDDIEQSKRFEDVARELGADKQDLPFKRAIERVLQPKKNVRKPPAKVDKGL